MKKLVCYPVGETKACAEAVKVLKRAGVTMIDHPAPEVSHLLLDVPWRGGNIQAITERLPEDLTVVGGNVPQWGGAVMDLLQDEAYLWENAAITARCAMHLAAEATGEILSGQRVLIIGWGRIGRHLARLLTALGAEVWLRSSKERNLAEAASLGIRVGEERDFDILFNTAPGIEIADEERLRGVKIELASKPGFRGDDTVKALGLPNRYAPKHTGELIAKTILRKLGEGRP